MPCRAELPHLVELAGRFEDRPVSVLAVLHGRRTGSADALIEESGATDIAYTDPSGTGFAACGVQGVPTTLIIDEAGRLMFRHVGFEEGMEEHFAEEIETLLAWGSET
jgi:hypothetical protein